MSRRSGRGWALLLLLAAICCTPCRAGAADRCVIELESLYDTLAEANIKLAECSREAQALRSELSSLNAVLGNLQRCCNACASGESAACGSTAELGAAQEELAAAEEQLEAAREHLAVDEADFERDGRDMATLRKQLFSARTALLEARQRLAAHEATRGGEGGHGRSAAGGAGVAGPDGGAGTLPATHAQVGACAAALQDCREELELLRRQSPSSAAAGGAAGPAGGGDGASCAAEQQLLAETRRRIAELSEERTQLAARLEKAVAMQGTCPSPSAPAATQRIQSADSGGAAGGGSHIAPVPDTSPRHSRRAEMVQTQMLADALAEIAALEEANSKLRTKLAALAWEGSTLTDLQAGLAAAQNRTAELAEELARCAGSLHVAREQTAELQQEKEDLQLSFASSQAVATSCQSRSTSLMEGQKEAEAALAEAKAQLAEALEEGERKVADAHDTWQARMDEAMVEAARQVDAAQQATREAVSAAEKKHAEAMARAHDKNEALQGALEEVAREKSEEVAARKAAEAAVAAAERSRAEAERQLAASEAELKAVREAKEGEIGRLLQLLQEKEEAARELQRASDLLRQAQAAWLPLWAQRLWDSGLSSATASAAILRQRASQSFASAAGRSSAAASSVWGRLEAAMGPSLQPALAQLRRAQQAAGQAWATHVRPRLDRAVPGWPEMEAAAHARLAAGTQALQAAGTKAQASVVAAKAAADGAALSLLRRALPALRLQHLATPAVASALVWSVAGLFTAPFVLALVLASLRWLAFVLWPGSVRVQPPGSSSGWARLEASLGHSFEQHSHLAAAVGGAASSRLSWLGSALLQLLAAEAAFKQQPEGAGPAELGAAAEALAGEPALAARSAAAGLARLVLPGPGAKALRMAADKSAQLYTACLWAAFVDSGFQLSAARDVFSAAGGTNGAAAGGAAADK